MLSTLWNRFRLFLFANFCVELKREATARSEIRDKVKEEQSASVAEEKGLAEQKHSETAPQTTDNIKQEQWNIHCYVDQSE